MAVSITLGYARAQSSSSLYSCQVRRQVFRLSDSDTTQLSLWAAIRASSP